MTHDELLHIIERHQNAQYQPDTRDVTAWEILQVIVELHKPRKESISGDCNECLNYYDSAEWPCPTIQAIEKELNN